MSKPPSKSKYDTLDPITEIKEPCKTCGKPIETMAFRGTGACGTLCYKVQNPEPEKPRH